MYKIVIAEDEEDVRKRIIKHINESDNEYTVVGEAGDGYEAIEVVRKLKPDILLTDICMPNVNGLELIRSIRELDKDMPIIVVSGYDDFSYAREAMSMGVREYLLKPFLPKELFEVLDKTKNIIEQKNQMITNMQNMSIEIKKNITYSIERFFRSLIEGKLGQQETEVTATDIGFNLNARWYCSGIVGFYTDDKNKINDIMAEYINIIKDNYFPENISIYEIRNSDEQLFMFFVGTGESKEGFLQSIIIGMEKICLSMKQYHRITAKCSLGNPYDNYKDLSKSFKEALATWRVILYKDKMVTIYSHNLNNANQIDEDKILDIVEKLILDIQMGDDKAAVCCIDNIIDYYSTLSPDMIEYISISLVKLVLKISDVMANANLNIRAWNDKSVLSYLKRHFTYGNLIEAKNVLAEYIKKCSAQFAQSNDDNSDKIIRNARFIIEENIGNEDFNLDILAGRLHFSSNYVRQLFKAKTGENFSDYLFRRRMEFAETLLRNPTYKIQDIAEKTGYSNQRYFARCFKKYYNSTPTEYREKYIT